VDPDKNMKRAQFDINKHYQKAAQVVREAKSDLDKGIITQEQYIAIWDEWKAKADEYRDEVLKRMESGKKAPTPIQ
jgi:hypothetical protein